MTRAASKDRLAHLGSDLCLVPFFQAHSWQELDLVPRPAIPVYPGDPIDLEVAAGGDNLRQALILRLLTPIGSLRDLGHEGYGSRLHELIGERNTPQNRLLARSFVLQAVAQERRVAEVLDLRVDDPTPDAPDTLRIHLHVLPAGGGDPIALGLEVGL
jgi:phage baseplate assembly protein W